MEQKLLSIGKVSKQKNISIKALRYYDEIGIFVPSYVNPETNYRYYTPEQLPMLDAVSLCLQLGIPLKTLPTYVKDGKFGFAELLADTRKLAEEKIHGIRLALEKIEGDAKCHPIKATSHSSSRSTFQFMEDEFLLALPLDKTQLPPFDGFILKLFIFARQHNLSVENPSCILYRYEKDQWQKYLCLHIASFDSNKQKACMEALSSANLFLFQIPAGSYSRRVRSKSIDMPSEGAFSSFGKSPEGLTFSLLERRLSGESHDTDLSFELIDVFTETIL